MNSDSYFDIVSVFAIGIVIAGIIAFILLAKRSNKRAKQSEEVINQLMGQLATDKQALFLMQYQNQKKNPTTAILLALFLGGIGAHKFYLNQVGLGIVYLIFSWTFIPGIISFIEAFSLAGKIGEYNEQKANEIYLLFK